MKFCEAMALLEETSRWFTHDQASLFSCYTLILVLFPIITFKLAREYLIFVFSCPSKCAASKGFGNFWREFTLYLYVNAVMMTLYYSGPSARCSNRSVVAPEPWRSDVFLGASAPWRPCHRFSKHNKPLSPASLKLGVVERVQESSCRIFSGGHSAQQSVKSKAKA
jgi:hypothetical protein